MIGFLSGRVLANLDSGATIVDVAGVGYEVHVATSEPLGVDSSVDLAVYTVVRADAIVLYGFTSFEERAFFAQLLATPGVGPSTALAALRTMPMNVLAQAIESGDHKTVASIPGIGTKTANRIVLELHGKLTIESPVAVPAGSVPDAIEQALRRLGYGPAEIRELHGVELPKDESAALRVALGYLGRT